MGKNILGELQLVNLREAWAHEALEFTPWLCENLHYLSDAIGIGLELEGREVPVESFSADILARNPQDDTRVLIENQLENADHSHLGQVLTYMAGLEASVVVWVAASFREAHISAISWLNEHTVDPFAFFAVRVKAVRIGESQIAPMFEVIARPNEWERTLQKAARVNNDISEHGRTRRAFWRHLAERHPDHFQVPQGYAASSLWRAIPNSDLFVVTYLGRHEVGVFIRGGRGEPAASVYDRLIEFDPTCWTRLDTVLQENLGGHFCVVKRKIEGHEPSNWDEASDWLAETSERFCVELSKRTLNSGL